MEDIPKTAPESLRLLASTRDTYCCSINDSRIRESRLRDVDAVTSVTPEAAVKIPRIRNEDDLEVNYFKSAQWQAPPLQVPNKSPDGTTLLTSSADNTIRTFVLPATLLSDPSPPILTPYTHHTHPTPINCFTLYPFYNLSDPSTTLYLSTPSALPIRLLNSLSPSTVPLSTYPLISTTTEAYYTPSSLLWSTQNHFLAGTDCLIALFDISRSGDGPVARMPTIPSKRHRMKGGGVGMRGLVSALSQQPSPENSDRGMLAAGTWTRWVGLYDMGGLGGTVATWYIGEAADKGAEIGGTGITETGWSACGRYLIVAERRSRGVLVYDVRVTGKLVAWLVGREADTNQRLGVGLFEGEKGMEVWAGGTGGTVKVWEGVGMTEGPAERAWEWKAHDDPVTSAAVHLSGTVVATCSGQRYFPEEARDDGTEVSESSEDDSSEDDSFPDSGSDSESSSGSRSSRPLKPVSGSTDNSIKVWSL